MTQAATIPRLHWEDFRPGLVFDCRGETVSGDEIVAFASRYDPQAFHLDEAAARATPYGGLIASGWHTAALAMRMMCDAYLLEAASLGSPGIDNLRWIEPVRPGDTLRLRMTVLSSRAMKSRPQAGLVESRWEVFNQHDRCVLEMRGWGMFGRRDSADS